jgi:tetratricopeptide (TPR) repeat protein
MVAGAIDAVNELTIRARAPDHPPVRAALVVLLVTVSHVLPARAQPEVDLRDEEARSLFESGRAAFAQGRYEVALGRFREAYELSGRAELLYNVAQCADRLRRDEEAIEAFERFSIAVPDAPERAQVEARLEVLRRQVADAARSRALREEHAELVADRANDRGAGPWVVVISGGAIAIAGGVFLGVALAERADIEGLTRADGTSFEEVEGALDRVPIFSTIGAVALGVGAAALAAGIVWLVADGGESETVSFRDGAFVF